MQNEAKMPRWDQDLWAVAGSRLKRQAPKCRSKIHREQPGDFVIFFRIEAIPISIAPTEIPEVLHKREHRGTRGEATEVEAAETPNLVQESRLSMASEIDSAVITEPPK